MHFYFGPLKRCGGLVVGGDKSINGFPQLANTAKAGPAQGNPAQDAEPDFDLVQPGSVRWRVVETNLGMLPQPAVMFGFVCVQIVQHDMEVPARMGGQDFIHEIQKK